MGFGAKGAVLRNQITDNVWSSCASLLNNAFDVTGILIFQSDDVRVAHNAVATSRIGVFAGGQNAKIESNTISNSLVLSAIDLPATKIKPVTMRLPIAVKRPCLSRAATTVFRTTASRNAHRDPEVLSRRRKHASWQFILRHFDFLSGPRAGAVPPHLAAPFIALDLPVSGPHTVGGPGREGERLPREDASTDAKSQKPVRASRMHLEKHVISSGILD